MVGTRAAGDATRSRHAERRGCHPAPRVTASARGGLSGTGWAAVARARPTRRRSGRLRKAGSRAQGQRGRRASSSGLSGERQTLSQRPPRRPLTQRLSLNTRSETGSQPYVVIPQISCAIDGRLLHALRHRTRPQVSLQSFSTKSAHRRTIEVRTPDSERYIPKRMLNVRFPN